jgi:hypothetical protein
MCKKVHFMLNLAASGELFSLIDLPKNLLLDKGGDLKVVDFGPDGVASPDQHLCSRKLVNPHDIWN